MKKLIALLLALCVCFSLIACGETESDDSDDRKKSKKDDEGTETVEEGAEKETEEVVVGADAAEVEIVNVYESKDVMPPKPTSFYTHYEASSGEKYVVVVMDVKNIGSADVSADDIVTATLEIDGSEYKANTIVEQEDGTEFGYGSSTAISPLSVGRLYQLFAVPENTDTDSMELVLINGENTYTEKLSVQAYEDKIATVTIGEVITDEETVSLTVDSVEFKNTLYPPNASGYYHYYEAETGKTYLIVKMTVKNLKGTDLKYDTIAGVSCVYNEKYNYTFFQTFEEDGGQDLNGYPSQYAIAPLDQGTCYYLAEVPEEVTNGPVEITFYIGGQYYKYTV